MKAVILTVIIAFIASLAMTISATFVQALNRSIPDFELNFFRSLGPTFMVLPYIIKVSVIF